MQGLMFSHPITTPIASQPAAKWSYISLFYSLFYFFPIALSWDRFPTGHLYLAFIAYGLFLFLFFNTLNRHGQKTILPIAAIIILAAGGSSINPGSNALFGYAAFLSSYYYAPRLAWLFLALNIAAQLASATYFDLFYIYYLGPSLAVSLSLFVYGRFSQRECLHQLETAEKNEQIEQLATIAERERIARDMHDLLGHSLSSLALKSELAEKLIDKDMVKEAQLEIRQVAELSRQTLAEVREAVTGLKHQSLDQNVKQLTRQLEHLGYQARSRVELPPIGAKLESCLNMLCKEWITNILRHSNGDAVSISLTHDDAQVHLAIEDNGRVETISPGNGIEGMKSRILELGGQFMLTHDNGVELQVKLPNTGVTS